MNLKKIILGIAVFIFANGHIGFAQDEAILDEDLEVIQMLELLEDLDLYQEDLDLLEIMNEMEEKDES